MTNTHSPMENHLLAALPAVVQGRLLPHMELVAMPLGKVMYESGDSLRHVYFPTDCIVSSALRDGRRVIGGNLRGGERGHGRHRRVHGRWQYAEPG
jgi:hypothetical protein